MINRADWIFQSSTGAAIGTGATTILTKGNIASGGVYAFRWYLLLANVGAPTNINFGLSGPTMSTSSHFFERFAAAGATYRCDLQLSLTDAAAGVAIATTVAKGEGSFVATSATAFNIRAIRVAGTSSTVQIGSWLECERIG